jgi:hypothetical protein
MRTHPSGRQHEAVGRVHVNRLAAVCPNDDVFGSNSLDSLRGRLGPSVGLIDPRCIHLHESTQPHRFHNLRGIGRRMCEEHLQTLLAPLPSQQQVFFSGCNALYPVPSFTFQPRIFESERMFCGDRKQIQSVETLRWKPRMRAVVCVKSQMYTSCANDTSLRFAGRSA